METMGDVVSEVSPPKVVRHFDCKIILAMLRLLRGVARRYDVRCQDDKTR